MRVVYDIPVLGLGHAIPSARTGIFRVVEHVAVGLARSEECDLAFSAIGPDWVRTHVQEYLDGKHELRSTPMVDALSHATMTRWIERTIAQRGPAAAVSFPARAMRAVLARVHYALADRSRLMAGAGYDADIFHSPHHRLRKAPCWGKSPARFLTIYDLIPLLFPEFFKADDVREMERVYAGLDRETWVLCISQATKDDLCDRLRFDPNRAFVTPLAAAPEIFYPCTDREQIAEVFHRYGIPNAPYLLSLNTLEPRKNLAHTIRCFVRMVRSQGIRDLNLVLVGAKGWQDEGIYAAIREAGEVRSRIILPGYVADTDLASLYSGATAFVYTSIYEGFGLPPLEAMQCGVPVITSNTSSLPEVVGDSGIMVSPDDEDGLSQAMLDLYRNASLRSELAQKGLSRSRQFTWARCIEDTLAAYRLAISA
jgi:glycosyltransferase involved in cell wall biosynthesis